MCLLVTDSCPVGSFNKKIEVVNRILGDLLRCPVGENPKQWEVVVAQVEFAYNYCGLSHKRATFLKGALR